MADLPPCSSFQCLDIIFRVNVKTALLAYSPECHPPDPKDLDKEKNDFQQEVAKNYPSRRVLECPNHCQSSFFDPIHQTVVQGIQENRKFKIKNCEYLVIFEYDVEAIILWGICKKLEA
jgi:hypothetical protein